MNRRSILKALFLGTPTLATSADREPVFIGLRAEDKGISDKRWYVLSGPFGRRELSHGQPEMNWLIENSTLTCMGHLPNTTAFLSDYRLSGEGKSFKAEMLFTYSNELSDQTGQGLHVGFRFSSNGNINEEARPIDAGLSSDGSLFIGEDKSDRLLKEEVLNEPLRLALSVITQSSGICFAKLRAFDRSGNTLATLSSTKYASSDWQGNIGVLSDYTGANKYNQPSVVICNFKIDGEKLVEIELKDEPNTYINQK